MWWNCGCIWWNVVEGGGMRLNGVECLVECGCIWWNVIESGGMWWNVWWDVWRNVWWNVWWNMVECGDS